MSVLKLQGTNEAAQGVYYEVDTDSEPLGGGGMGSVFPGYRVDAFGVRREAAIKFLFDDLPATVIERAKQEASIQIKNDNLLEMFGFIQIDQVLDNGKQITRYHVASELLHGVMLFDLLRGVTHDKQGVSIDYAKELYQLMQSDRRLFALTITRNVLSGIMALHDAGFAHRDIDPSNIMVTADRKIKVIDFGIVKNLNVQSPQLSIVGQFLGKPSYAAPEIVNGWVHDQNQTTDIYAIGIMFFELLTGHLPFVGSSDEVIEKQKNEMLPLSEIREKDLTYVLRKATSKRQASRYQSVSEMRVDIEHLLAGTPITLATVINNNDSNSTKHLNMPAWLGWVLIVAIGIIVGVVLSLLL